MNIFHLVWNNYSSEILAKVKIRLIGEGSDIGLVLRLLNAIAQTSAGLIQFASINGGIETRKNSNKRYLELEIAPVEKSEKDIILSAFDDSLFMSEDKSTVEWRGHDRTIPDLDELLE